MVAFYFFSAAREEQNFPKELGGAGISLPNFWQENIILKIYYKDTFLSFKDFIYLFERERQPVREGTQAGGVGEEEAGFPLSREPDAGLNPRTL